MGSEICTGYQLLHSCAASNVEYNSFSLSLSV